MALQTPLGSLDTLDITAPSTQRDILMRDKHRLLEGLVVEEVFRGILDRLSDQCARSLPLSLVRAASRGRADAWFIWNHESSDDSATKLHDLLEQSYRNRVVSSRYYPEQRDFMIDRYRQYKGFPLQDLLGKHRNVQPFFEIPDQNVRDADRLMQSIYGLKGARADFDMFNEVVLHRLFKNCALSAYFRWVWDTDNIIELPDGRFIQLEVKHKYPFPKNGNWPLKFGINTGQVNTMKRLSEAGIDTFHLILVKPRWEDSTSPEYLIRDIASRDKVLLIGRYLDAETLESIEQSAQQTSGKTESYSGNQAQDYKPVLASGFVHLGTLDDRVEDLGANILAGMQRRPLPPVRDEDLREKRLA